MTIRTLTGGDLSPLQWMAPDLVRAGLIRNEAYIEPNTARAVKLFPNQGMHAAVTLLAALHPRAIEYLEQAPVLALAASFGARANSRRDRAYIAMNFGPVMDRGAKLKDVLKTFRIAYPLRAISANAIRPGVWGVIQAISRLVDPSTIAQAIPAEPTRHMYWLAVLDALWAVLQRRRPDERINAPILRWAMLALSRAENHRMTSALATTEIADFLICNSDHWNTRWTWDRLADETLAWHEALANAQVDAINDARYDQDVDYGRFPTELTIDGFEFVALRSLRALIVEGRAMHHCVASYYPDVLSGRARIYSIRKDGARLATVEMCPWADATAGIAQLKGFANADPRADVAKAARQAATEITKRLRA